MTKFTELIKGLKADNRGFTTRISEDWQQGRTVYGGLSAALCYETAFRTLDEPPPLRSAQFCFIGPAAGELSMSAAPLRRGKSTIFVGADLFGEDGLATRATFCFATPRESVLSYNNLPCPDVPSPDNSQPLFELLTRLNFTSHFHGKLAGGHMPMSGADTPEMLIWLKHKDSNLRATTVALLALADAPPPAAIVRFPAPAPLSTMTWSLDCLTDDISSDDGWFLVRTRAETITDGYSSQTMTIWNSAGKPLVSARQNIAVFL